MRQGAAARRADRGPGVVRGVKASSWRGKKIRPRGGWGDGGKAQLPAEEFKARGVLQQEVARAAGTAAGCRAEKRSSVRGGREREFLKDLFVKLKNYRDSMVN
jgi:hypothetical protein